MADEREPDGKQRGAGFPVPDREIYARAVRSVFPAAEAEQLLKEYATGEGWTAFGSQLAPPTLAIIVLSREYAEWYVRTFPADEAKVREIRSMPEEDALRLIREGRWSDYIELPPEARE